MTAIFVEVGEHQGEEIFLRENKKSLMKTMSLLRIQHGKQKWEVQFGERICTMAKKKIAKCIWPKSEVTLLRKLFPNNPTAKVAARLKRSLDTVKKKASRMGLQKTKKYLKSLGRT